MKKIFTLISVALVAISANAQTETESYLAVDQDGNMASAYAAVVDENKVATNVVNGNSVVKFSTTNVEVEAVGSGVPADKVDPDDPTANIGQDITIGAVINADEHTYELVSINSTKDIKWEVKSQGDINFFYIAGTGNPAVSMYAKQNSKDGDLVDNAYSVVVVAFDPATGGEPLSGLYYKFTTKVDGALKVGIWANKGNRTTFLVDGDTKQPSEYLVEGYVNGQSYTQEDVDAGKATAEQIGQKKWLSNDEIVALNTSGNPWIIGPGNQNFWGNVIIDAKAGKTYWLFQGNSQIGFQGYTFAPGAKKEELVTDVKAIKNIATANDAPVYNLAGQRVNAATKGLLIKNGKKFINK